MTLERATVDVHLGGGLAQDADPRAAPQGSFITLENVVYDLKGAARKRAGYAAMTAPAGGSFPGAVALAVDGDALYCVTEPYVALSVGTPARLHSYGATPDAWRVVGDVHRVSPTVAPLARSSKGAYNGFVYERTGLRWELWEEPTTGVFYRAIDIDTGAVVYSRTAVGTFNSPESVVYCALGSDIVIVESSDPALVEDIKVRFLDTLTGTVATRGGGVVGAAAGYVAQQAIAFDASHFLVVCTTGGATIYLALLAASNTSTTAATTFGATTAVSDIAMTLLSASSLVVVTRGGAASAGGIYAWKRSVTLGGISAVWGPITLGAGVIVGGSPHEHGVTVAPRANGDALCVWTSQSDVEARGVSGGGTAYVTMTTTNNAALCTHAFLQDGLVYCALSVPPLLSTIGTTTLTLVCMDSRLTDSAAGDDPVLAAIVLRERAAYNIQHSFLPRSVTQPSSSRALFAANVLASSAITTSGTNSAVDRVDLDFGPHGFACISYDRASGLVALSGGVLGYTDANNFFEAGFVNIPDLKSHTLAAGSIAPGVYGYAVCYAWLDSAGNTHRSSPARFDIDTSGAGSPQSHSLDLRCIALTRKAGIFLEVYRTLVGTPGPFYRLTPPLGLAVSNDPAAETVTYIDVTSDTALALLGYGFLYADDELENVQPPSAYLVLSHKNRLWLVSAEDRREVWYSKPLVAGHPPEFAAELTMRLDDASEPITALASLDTNLVICTASRVYYVAGDGPNATGAGSTFSDPQRVQNDAGCDDARSVGTLADGALLTSARGAALLDRKLVVSFIGAPVKVDVDAYPTALGVVVDTVRMRAYLAVATAARTSFRVLVYDYEKNVWTTWHITGLAGSEPCRAHALWRGDHVIAGKGGVYLEALGTRPGYDPGVTWVTQTIETPWLQTGGAGGYQRVWTVTVTGRRLSACSLKVEAFTDYGDTADSSRTFDLQSGSTVDGLPVVRLEMGIVKQRCSALKIRITDIAPGTFPSVNPTGFDLLSITLDVGLMPGRARLPAVNKG